MKSRRRALLSIPALLSFGVLLPASASEPASAPPSVTEHRGLDAGEAGYRALPDLPLGVAAPGPAGVRRSAIALAASLRAVPIAEGSTEPCPEERLTVSWDVPGPSFGHGAFVEPLGPPPTEGTTSVNGVVVCSGADWAFMGFEGRYVGGRWNVVAVPFVDEEVGEHAGDDHGGHDDHGHHGDGRDALDPIGPVTSIPLPAPGAHGQRSFSGPIDGYARYEPQRTCAPAAKPGTLALQRLLMDGAPGSRNLGISRACHIGGSSEHKEGRAFDWGVLVHRPAERAAAEDFLTRLLATDADGNRHALARRMGVMYVIWNQKIWSSYRPHDGWRPYSGRSPHTDHVHISLSWDGALGRTSYWSGHAMEGLSFLPSPSQQLASAPVSTAPAPAPEPSPPASPAPSPPATHSPVPTHDDGAAARAAHEARKAAEEVARHQQKAAEEDARRQQQAAAEHARRAEQAAAEHARQQQKAAAEQARQAQKAAREAERRQQKATAPAPTPAPVASGGGHGAGGNGGKSGGNGKGKGR